MAPPREERDQVFLTPAAALAEIFPEHGSVLVDLFRPSLHLRDLIAERSGSKLPPGPVEVLRVLGKREGVLGSALVIEEKGKYRPITFMVGIGSDLKVRGVRVMVYREDRGDEVRHRRFLRQYVGKGMDDPIRAPGDIDNITGATISVGSMNRGVRRALATVAVLYGGSEIDAVETYPFDAGR